MIEIFIPVLVVCLNGTCEFMQAKTTYTNEASCRASVNVQKQHMLQMAEKADQVKYTVLEGTCINAHINDPDWMPPIDPKNKT